MTKAVRIADRRVGAGSPAFIVAEVGINHGGDVAVAHRYVDTAADAHADAVKFQTIDANASYVPGTPSHQEFSGKELSYEDYASLLAHSRERGIVLFATPGDFPSLELCARLGLPAIKISSGLMTNAPLVRAAARLGVPLLISTGASYLWEVARVVDDLRRERFDDIVVLHCVSTYPSRPELLNLRCIPALAGALGCAVGYSDHTMDALACTTAVALDARVIEKHLTLDRRQPGADHRLSAEPQEFAALVRQIRTCESMLGGAVKEPQAEELAFRERFRRRLVASRDIARGEPLTADAIGLMRALEPAGLSPDLYSAMIGRRATRDIRRHEPIDWDCVTIG